MRERRDKLRKQLRQQTQLTGLHGERDAPERSGGLALRNILLVSESEEEQKRLDLEKNRADGE